MHIASYCIKTQERDHPSPEMLLSGPLRVPIVQSLLMELSKQCQDLCRKKEFSSTLRRLEPTQLTEFAFKNVVEEWRKVAPLLLQFVCCVANVPLLADGSPPSNAFPCLCMAGALLLRQRNVPMSALHHLVGLILFHGNASKQVGIAIHHIIRS